MKIFPYFSDLNSTENQLEQSMGFLKGWTNSPLYQTCIRQPKILFFLPKRNVLHHLISRRVFLCCAASFYNNLRLQKNFSPIIPLGRIGLHYYPVHHALISSKFQLHHPGNPRSFDRRVCPRE